MKSFLILLKNELKLNIRNMNMVIFAVIMPLHFHLRGWAYGAAPCGFGISGTKDFEAFSSYPCQSYKITCC